MQFDWLIVFWPVTRESEFCQKWDWWWNINNNISFHFRLFPRKTNDKNLSKNLKDKQIGRQVSDIVGPSAWRGPKNKNDYNKPWQNSIYINGSPMYGLFHEKPVLQGTTINFLYQSELEGVTSVKEGHVADYDFLILF